MKIVCNGLNHLFEFRSMAPVMTHLTIVMKALKRAKFSLVLTKLCIWTAWTLWVDLVIQRRLLVSWKWKKETKRFALRHSLIETTWKLSLNSCYSKNLHWRFLLLTALLEGISSLICLFSVDAGFLMVTRNFFSMIDMPNPIFAQLLCFSACTSVPTNSVSRLLF